MGRRDILAVREKGLRVGRVAYVIRTFAEADRFCSEAPEADFLCANERAYERCRAAGRRSVLLDETLLRDRYDDVNRWGYEQALRGLSRLSGRERQMLDGALFDLRIYFIRSLKFILVFEALGAGTSYDEIRITDDGQSLLTAALQGAFPGKIRILPALAMSQHRAPAVWRRKAVQTAVDLTGGYARVLLSRWMRRGTPVYLLSGSLKHLAGIVNRLPAGHAAVFCETQFDRQKALFCVRNGIAHVVLPDQTLPDELASLASRFPEFGTAVFDGIDRTEALRPVFYRAFSGPLTYRPFDQKKLELFLDEWQFKAVILDEDLALRRPLFLAAEKRAIPCFTVSHGVPARRIFAEESPPGVTHRSSVTFVQSAFEREMYESLGYETSKLRVTGLPRYDRMAELKRMSRRAGDRKIILHCTGSLLAHDFVRRSAMTDVLGSSTYCRLWSRRYLADLVAAAARDTRCELWVKPHYAEEIEWERALRELGSPKFCRIFSHRADTALLEFQADVIVTPESSVICEGIMLDKPVLVLDYPGDFRTSLYDLRGVVERVRSAEHLETALTQSLFDGAYLENLAARRRACGEYFTGVLDGGAAERVWAHLVQRAEGSARIVSGRKAGKA